MGIGKTNNPNLGVMQAIAYYNNSMRIRHPTIPHIYGSLFKDWTSPRSPKWGYMETIFLSHPKSNYDVCKKNCLNGFVQFVLFVIYTFTVSEYKYYVTCDSILSFSGLSLNIK